MPVLQQNVEAVGGWADPGWGSIFLPHGRTICSNTSIAWIVVAPRVSVIPEPKPLNMQILEHKIPLEATRHTKSSNP